MNEELLYGRMVELTPDRKHVCVRETAMCYGEAGFRRMLINMTGGLLKQFSELTLPQMKSCLEQALQEYGNTSERNHHLLQSIGMEMRSPSRMSMVDPPMTVTSTVSSKTPLQEKYSFMSDIENYSNEELKELDEHMQQYKMDDDPNKETTFI